MLLRGFWLYQWE